MPLHGRARPFRQFELPALLDALEDGADALALETFHHRGQKGEACARLHQMVDPAGVELHDVRLQALDAIDVGTLRAVVVDGDAEPSGTQGFHKAAQCLLRRRGLFGHLADHAARIYAGFVQHQPHLAQRAVADRAIDEHGRIEIDEDRCVGRQACAGIEQVKRARQHLDMQPLRAGACVEKARGRLRLAVTERAGQPFECLDHELAFPEGEDRLKGAFQHIEAPHAGRGAVVVADDVGKPYVARQGFFWLRGVGMDPPFYPLKV